MREHRGIADHEILNGPTLLACGAYVSVRVKSVRCQACYGRHRCRCGSGTGMPCESGLHLTPGGKRAHAGNTGRINRGFVDINGGRRGINNR